jgi:hypothetical protein
MTVNRFTTLALPALVVLVALGTGCLGMPEPPAAWVKGDIEAKSDRVLWDVTRMALEKTGFPVTQGVDPSSMSVTSGWDVELAPFRRKGKREQATVRYTRESPGTFSVDVRVKREINLDIVRPLDATYAEWSPSEDNPGRAGVVIQYIKALLASGS